MVPLVVAPPWVISALGDEAAALVEVSTPVELVFAEPLALPEASELPVVVDVALPAESLIEPTAEPPVSEFCAIAAVPSSAAATTRESLSMSITS
jgi:hypothetical protein